MRSAILLPLALSFSFAFLCYLAAGASLGLFLGALVGITIVVPPMVMREKELFLRVLAAGAVVDGAAMAWLLPVFWGPIGLGAFVACYLVAAAYALALGGVVIALERVVADVFAAAMTVLVGLAWLSWPIWLAEAIRSPGGEHVAGWLIPVSPTFAMNTALKSLGMWSERSIAYHITNLNQHVPYTLPASILPCMIFHLLIGAALLWLGSGLRCALRSTSQIDNTANPENKK